MIIDSNEILTINMGLITPGGEIKDPPSENNNNPSTEINWDEVFQVAVSYGSYCGCACLLCNR